MSTLRSAPINIFAVLLGLAGMTAAQTSFDETAVLRRAEYDAEYRSALITDPKRTLGTHERVRIVDPPTDTRILVLPPLRRMPPELPVDATVRFQVRIATDLELRQQLKADWISAFNSAGATFPTTGKLIVIDPAPGERILVLPPLAALLSRMPPTSEPSARVAFTARPCATCPEPPAGPDPGPRPRPSPISSDIITTMLRIDHKRWNQNPLGPGCKNDTAVRFEIPEGASLHSVTMGERGCDSSMQDVPVGKYVDTHVALGIVAGGTVFNSRPAKGATGGQELSYHWWFNQWGHSQAVICINVISRKALTLDATKTERYSHVNMDDGWVKHRVKLPACFREAKIGIDLQGPIDGRHLTYKDVKFGAKVVQSDNCVIEWFGCKDDQNVLH